MARREAMTELVELWKAARGGAYYVRRGPILWPTHEFERKDRAVAIIVDHETLDRAYTTGEPNEARITFEVGARIPPGEDIDDVCVDEFKADAVTVLRRLAAARDGNGDSLVAKIGDHNATVKEWADLQFGLHGVEVTLDIAY